MKNFTLILAVLCVVFLGGCGKKSTKENLATNCKNEIVLAELKNAIVAEFEPLCKKGEEWIEYCNAQNGEFDRTLIEFDAELGECSVPFDIPDDDIPGWIISYTAKNENGKFSVKMLDYMAY